MIRIVYTSRATEDPDAADLRGLLGTARELNEQHGVTGMLLYAHGSFMQVVEGADDAVRATYARIASDDRHTDLQVLLDGTIAQREFSDWAMGFDHLDDEALLEGLPGFKAAERYPLINAALVHDATVATTLLRLYARNP